MMGTTSFLVVSESSYVNPEYLGLIEIGLLGAWFVSYSTELAIFFAYLCHMYWIYFNVHDFKSYIVFIFLLLYICLLIYLLLHRTLCNSKYIIYYLLIPQQTYYSWFSFFFTNAYVQL